MTTPQRVVLIGEPDMATAELYRRALCSTFDVITAPYADALLDMLRARTPTALVLEPTIFGARSWEQLAIVSYICAEHDILLIVCSTLDERRRGLDLGITSYLVKPALPATLLALVQELLNARSR